MKDKTVEFILSPKFPLFRGSTVITLLVSRQLIIDGIHAAQ